MCIRDSADTEYKITELGITRTLALKRNQVILDESFIRSGNVQRLCAKRRFTLAHECAHQILFQLESEEVKACLLYTSPPTPFCRASSSLPCQSAQRKPCRQPQQQAQCPAFPIAKKVHVGFSCDHHLLFVKLEFIVLSKPICFFFSKYGNITISIWIVIMKIATKLF